MKGNGQVHRSPSGHSVLDEALDKGKNGKKIKRKKGSGKIVEKQLNFNKIPTSKRVLIREKQSTLYQKSLFLNNIQLKWDREFTLLDWS